MSNRVRRRTSRRMNLQSVGTAVSSAVQSLQMSAVKYVPTASSFLRALNEGETNLIHAQMQCITAMEFYKDLCLEELRLNDYLAKSFLVSPSDETKQHFTLKAFKPYVAVIDLSPSCEDDSTVDCISWPVRSSEPNSTQVEPHVESSCHSTDLEQDSVRGSCSSSPATDRSVEVPVLLSGASSVPVQNSGDEVTSVSQESLTSSQKLANTWTSFDKCDADNVSAQANGISRNSDALGSVSNNDRLTTWTSFDKCDVDNVTAQANGISRNSDALVSVSNNDRLTNFTECLTSISSLPLDTAGNDAHISSASGIYKYASSDNSINDKHGNGLAAAGSLLIERNMNQNNDEPAENGQSREQYGVEGSKENPDALFDEIGCLTDLQKSLSAAIGPTRNRELLGWIIVNELQASRNILQYQKLPLNLLRAEVKHRTMMTRQLIDQFGAISIYSQLHRLIEVSLVEEFGFICHLKRIMIAKSMESQSNDTSETKDRCGVFPDYPNAVLDSPGSSVQSFKQRRRVQIVTEENANDDVCKHVSDMYAQRLLNRETDILMFSEPGKLFRFEVLPGSRFVESWRRRGSGVVSLFQDKTAEMVKIVVRHWSSKEDYSLILIRSSMKTKTAMSKSGLQLKFMGLEVSNCRERMRYFMIQFESSRITKAFNKLLHSLTFLNISDHSPDDSGSVCCLDVVFKSHRIHEEFPSMTGDDETDHMTYDDDGDDVMAKDEWSKDGFHDVDEFKFCSDGKTVPDENRGAAGGIEFCIAEDFQKRRNSFPFFSRALSLAKIPAIENQELEKIGQRCGQEVMKTCNCPKLLKAYSEKCLLDVKQTETHNDYITGMERKTEIVKDLVENDCSEVIRGSSTENYSASLSDAEISCSTNLFAYGGPSFCVYRNGSGDIDEDTDKTDITQDRLKFIPEGAGHLLLDQGSGFTQNADGGNCAFKLSPASKFQFPSADDQELSGLKGETLLLEHDKTDDEDSNSVSTENQNQNQLSPTEIPESSSVLNCDSFQQETSNVGSRNCDHTVENDASESRCDVSHANKFHRTILNGLGEEDEIVNNEKKLEFEKSEVL